MQAQSVDEEVWPDDLIPKTVQSAARRVRSRFFKYVELEDMLQEAWTAVYTAENLITTWQTEGKDGASRLYRHIAKACTIYAQKNKAARLGYHTKDLFYYSLPQLRYLIPLVMMGVEDARFLDAHRDREEWVDVYWGLQTLPEADLQILVWAFVDSVESYEVVAERLRISGDAARQRVNRVLRRVQDALGGEAPYSVRRSKSNVAALAETRSAWEGEG